MNVKRRAEERKHEEKIMSMFIKALQPTSNMPNAPYYPHYSQTMPGGASFHQEYPSDYSYTN